MIAALKVPSLVFRRLVNRQSLKLVSASALASFKKFCRINPSTQWKETYKKDWADILKNA
jgi:hypothetical protein